MNWLVNQQHIYFKIQRNNNQLSQLKLKSIKFIKFQNLFFNYNFMKIIN